MINETLTVCKRLGYTTRSNVHLENARPIQQRNSLRPASIKLLLS